MPKSPFWTTKEDNFLRENYSELGPATCAKRLKRRTPTAVTQRAKVLGITSLAVSWKPEEDAFLRENYAELGPKGCAEILPNRSRSSVRSRAAKLGLAKPRNSWTPEEDALLRENYAKLGPKGCAELLPNRTPETIYSHAQVCGLVTPRKPKTLPEKKRPHEPKGEYTAANRVAEINGMIDALPNTETSFIYRAELERRKAQLEGRYG